MCEKALLGGRGCRRVKGEGREEEDGRLERPFVGE